MQIYKNIKKFKYMIFICIISTLLVSCSTRQQSIKKTLDNQDNNTNSLERLQKITTSKQHVSSIGKIRLQALRDAALSLGAQAGLASKAKKINDILNNYDTLLHRVFNFNRLILDDNILPPVLIEGRNQLEINRDDVIRLVDRTYHIISQARFITAAPNWRDYLWLKFKAPDTPDNTLLPKDKPEKLVWNKFIQDGWQAGEIQANLIFEENLSRLRRDYEGMIRYRTLLAQNMVSKPFVAKVAMGITGGNEHLIVNDRILRITSFPSLQVNGETWNTQMTAVDKKQ